MSVGYHEWHGVLFISVWRASACSPGRELCCLEGETGNRACTKSRAVTSNRVIGLSYCSHGYKLQFHEMVNRCSKGPVQ